MVVAGQPWPRPPCCARAASARPASSYYGWCLGLLRFRARAFRGGTVAPHQHGQGGANPLPQRPTCKRVNSNTAISADPPIWSGHPKSNFGRLSRWLCAAVRRRCVISVDKAFARGTAVARRALSAFVVGFHRCSGPMFKIKVASCTHGTNDAAHAQMSGLPALFSAPSPQLYHRRSAPTKRHCGVLMPSSVIKMINIE